MILSDFATYDILVVLEEALLQQREVLPAKFPLKCEEMGVDPRLVLALDKYNSSSTLPHYILLSTNREHSNKLQSMATGRRDNGNVVGS